MVSLCLNSLVRLQVFTFVAFDFVFGVLYQTPASRSRQARYPLDHTLEDEV